MILTLILIAAFIAFLAIIFIPIVLKKSAPIFVYVMCLVWLGIFFLGLKQLRYALILWNNLWKSGIHFCCHSLNKRVESLCPKGLASMSILCLRNDNKSSYSFFLV
ncbi:hypothetical protein BLFGPEAP_02237 [Candidatus Methanoperedenaceae archaeon GB50]|nr:hypothetical protein BLFGPEAP_02237 [Candidatus Methanoperedenaceae archaeon GB50]